MAAPVYTPAPVLDVVTFGYKRFFKALWPTTKMSLPFLLFSGLTSGFVYPEMATFNNIPDSQADIPTELWITLGVVMAVFLIGLLAMLYVVYGIFRYCRDDYLGCLDKNVFAYLMPTRTFWGLIGISIIFALATLPLVALMVLGFFLFILPGLAVLAGLVFLMTRFSMVGYAYMARPERGIFVAFGESWRLTENNFWRTFALGLIAGLVQSFISMPFQMGTNIVQLVMELAPNFAEGFLFASISAVLMTISYWGQFVIGPGSGIYVTFRFFLDLDARKNPPAAMPGNPLPG